MKDKKIPVEYRVISGMISRGSRVLELGCGSGDLLEFLVNEKEVEAQGLEINEKAIYSCVEKGLSVLHGDIENGLSEYRSRAFDYVVMDRTFQELNKPSRALDEALRVGRKVIVVFSNFVHYKAWLQLFFRGRVPVTESLPYEWYDTPNRHFLSTLDFKEYCRRRNIQIERAEYASKNRRVTILPNLFARSGIFLVSRNKKDTMRRKKEQINEQN